MRLKAWLDVLTGLLLISLGVIAAGVLNMNMDEETIKTNCYDKYGSEIEDIKCNKEIRYYFGASREESLSIELAGIVFVTIFPLIGIVFVGTGIVRLIV